MINRGWVFVLLGLLLCSFLGGGIRVYFSPVRVRELISHITKIRQPKFNFEFSSAKLKLQNNGWPTIAIEMQDIVVRAKDPCITNSTIAIDQILIPFEIRYLLKKKVKFGHVHAKNVQFHYRPNDCEVEPALSSSTDEVAQFEKFFQRRWSQEVVNTSKILRSLSLDSLTLLRDNQSLPPAVFENVQLRFDSKAAEGDIDFNVRWGAPWIGQSPFGLTRVKATIRADEVQVLSSGNLKEGQMKSTLSWAIDRGDILFQVNSKDMPLNYLIGFAHHWGLFSNFNPTFKNQWLDCDLSMDGPIREIMNLPIHLHQCRLYGDLGEMQIKTNKIKSLTAGGVLAVRIQNLDVREILTGFGAGKTWGVVSNFGRFSGEFVVPSRSDFELKGEVVGSELYLSSQESRLRQSIDRFTIQLAQSKGRFSGLAEGIVLKNGIVKGGVTFNFQDLSEGIFQFALSEIQLPREVQKIFFDAEVDHLAIYGQGRFQNFKLLDFRGSVGSKRYKTENFVLNHIKMDLDHATEIWHVQAKVEDVSTPKTSVWGKVIEEYLTHYFKVENDFIHTKLVGEVEFDGQSGVWSNVIMQTQKPNQEIQSTGSWNTAEGLQGKVWVYNRAKPHLKTSQTPKFELDGTWEAPIFRAVENDSTNP